MPDHSVRMPPGSMTTTSTSKGVSSMRSASESASTAYFVAWYQPPSGVVRRPPMEETLMMVPLRRSRMPGVTRRARAVRPKTSTSNWRRASSSGTSSMAP